LSHNTVSKMILYVECVLNALFCFTILFYLQYDDEEDSDGDDCNEVNELEEDLEPPCKKCKKEPAETINLNGVGRTTCICEASRAVSYHPSTSRGYTWQEYYDFVGRHIIDPASNAGLLKVFYLSLIYYIMITLHSSHRSLQIFKSAKHTLEFQLSWWEFATNQDLQNTAAISILEDRLRSLFDD
jgi:hypothetical protein